MSLDSLDPVLTKPKRLAALSIAARSPRVDFPFIRDALGLSDSDLSKQMSALVDAGYVKNTKVGRGRGRVTWFSATRKGRTALGRHMAALTALVEHAPKPDPEPMQAPGG